MRVLTKTELSLKHGEVLGKIRKGIIFIHPTDTIYGIGCDATNEKAVKKVRKLKSRPDKPLPVWVPSLNWIKDNCVIDKRVEKWLEKLPGPYTLIFKLKNKISVAESVVPNTDSLGVRLPDHWFSRIVEELGFPIVTTSANKKGESFMTSLEDLDPEIKVGIDFIIYEGEKKARPSKIVDLVKGKTIER